MANELGTTAFSRFNEDFNGFYRGQVTNNLDPQQLGQIQVQVLPMLSGVAPALLPWAIPAGPLFSGSGTGYGTFMVPEIGSWVWVFFEQGNIYQPVYFASASDGVHGIPSESQTNYPNRRVIHTKAGIVIYTDDTTKTIVLKTPGGLSATLDDASDSITLLQSASGAFIEIDATGRIILNGTNITVTTSGTTTWTGTGSITITGSQVNINPI